MSNFLDQYHRPSNPLKEDAAWADAMQARYPLLVDAMVGSEGSGVSGPTRPRLSFILSTKDGRLRFSLSSPESSRSYFGPIDDPSEPLAAAERALEGNKGEWVTKSERSSGRRS